MNLLLHRAFGSARSRLPVMVTVAAIGLAAIGPRLDRPAGAQPAPDPALLERARDAIGRYNSVESREDRIALRAELVALADTLTGVGQDELTSECLERAGILSYLFGEIENAMEVWTRGLAAARRSNDPKRVAALLNARATGVSASGDNLRALDLFEELIEIRRSLDDARGEGIAWHNLAYSQLALFRYPEAIASLREAIRLHELAHNDHGLAGSRHALVQLLLGYGERDEALAMADSALAAAERTQAPQFIGMAASTRAMLLHEGGRLDEALVGFERASTILRDCGAEVLAAACTVNHADALVSAGRPQDAIAMLEDALPTEDASGVPSNGILARSVLGRAHMAAGEPEEARRVLEDAVGRFYAMQDTLGDPVSQADANTAASAVTYLAILHARQGRHEAAFSCLEESLARILRRQLRPEERPATVAELQRALRKLNATALLYGIPAVGGEVAVVVTFSGVHAVELAPSSSVLDDVHALMDLMASGASDAQCNPVRRRVAAALLGPVQPYMEDPRERPDGDFARRLILVPGGFGGLAFESLPLDPRDALGDRYSIVYAPSASTFLALEARGAAGSEFLALADPVIDPDGLDGTLLAMRARSLARLPLPEAREEVARIAPPGAVTFAGPEATRQAFLEHAGAAAVVHLATHAIVDSYHPRSSALLLASRDGGTTALDATDIEAASLSADLVTLSGCETAGGYRSLGEGAFGLTRAFLLAGARSVVASWWDVEDAAARRFMELFYAALAEGTDRDVAVQQARRVMREEGFLPRDRAAFAVTGAVSGSIPILAGPVSSPRQPLRWFLPGIVVLALVAIFTLTRRRRAFTQ